MRIDQGVCRASHVLNQVEHSPKLLIRFTIIACLIRGNELAPKLRCSLPSAEFLEQSRRDEPRSTGYRDVLFNKVHPAATSISLFFKRIPKMHHNVLLVVF